MCGFLGEFCFESNQITKEAFFRDLLELSKHRGPDSSLILRENQFQLGFNRLAILDLTEKGNQPKQSLSGRYHIVFNGEIYNYQDLAKIYKLENLNSTSDTEVLIHLLDLLGIEETIKQLNGMFAIAIIDMQTNKLYITRDFAGIKPLYFGLSKQGVVFASQFDQIFKHDWFKDNLKLRPKIIKEYFGFGYMQAPNTIYQNIFQVIPGEFIDIDSIGNINKIRLTSFSKIPKTNLKEDSNSVDLLNKNLSKVVDRHLISDVPIATFLSGGIDSPLIAAHAKLKKPDIHALTLEVSNQELNESYIAKNYASYLNIEQELVRFKTLEILNLVDEHFKCYSEPFADFSSIPTYAITKKAKQTHTVMLSGDGGDELFWGYPRMLSVIKHKNWFKIPFLIRKPIIRLAKKLKITDSWAPYYYRTIQDWIIAKQMQIFPDILDKMVPNSTFSDEMNALFNLELTSKTEMLQFLRWNEFYGHLQRVLIKVDRASMGSSVEVRVPLLDRDIIELAWKIKPDLGGEHQVLKKVLKEALKLHIPESQIFKDKKGFSVPLEQWLRNELKSDVEELVFKTPFYGKEFMDVAKLKEYVTAFFEGKSVGAWGVWHIYAWQKWAKNQGLIERVSI